jgi:uncharacterized protein (TIGR00288 family)
MTKLNKIAMLIDADNSPAKSIQNILSELARHGKVYIRRAYGNWTSHNLKGWEASLFEYAIQPIQQYDLTKGKNATDIAMTIDAMDILYTKNIDIICLVTSDCDFTPLVTRILAEGKIVIGFGERKTPQAFVNVCSNFLYLNDPTEEKQVKKLTRNELRGDTKLMNMIRDAISATQDEEGWSKLSKVGTHISNRASFDPRNYGYSRLSDLVTIIELFELRRDSNKHFEIRRKI